MPVSSFEKLFGEKAAYSLVYLYLLHRPTHSYQMAKDFRKVLLGEWSENRGKEIQLFKNLRVKSLKERSHAGEILREMEMKGLLFSVEIENESPDKENITQYYVNPEPLFSRHKVERKYKRFKELLQQGKEMGYFSLSHEHPKLSISLEHDISLESVNGNGDGV